MTDTDDLIGRGDRSQKEKRGKMIFPSKIKPIIKDVSMLIIMATFLLINMAIVIAPKAKGMAKKQASVGRKGKALLTAVDIKIPILMNTICRRAIIPNTNKSTLERADVVIQFLVRQRYRTIERNKEVKKNPRKIVYLEKFLSLMEL